MINVAAVSPYGRRIIGTLVMIEAFAVSNVTASFDENKSEVRNGEVRYDSAVGYLINKESVQPGEQLYVDADGYVWDFDDLLYATHRTWARGQTMETTGTPDLRNLAASIRGFTVLDAAGNQVTATAPNVVVSQPSSASGDRECGHAGDWSWRRDRTPE